MKQSNRGEIFGRTPAWCIHLAILRHVVREYYGCTLCMITYDNQGRLLVLTTKIY